MNEVQKWIEERKVALYHPIDVQIECLYPDTLYKNDRCADTGSTGAVDHDNAPGWRNPSPAKNREWV
jgi:hypothetical protein